MVGERNRTAQRSVGHRVGDDRTDTELILASRADPATFVELYRRHAEDLLQYFARRTLDPESAAELTAETFAEAFSSRGRDDSRARDVAHAWVTGELALNRLSMMTLREPKGGWPRPRFRGRFAKERRPTCDGHSGS
jgi:hypothetical protein